MVNNVELFSIHLFLHLSGLLQLSHQVLDGLILVFLPASPILALLDLSNDLDYTSILPFLRFEKLQDRHIIDGKVKLNAEAYLTLVSLISRSRK